MPKFNEKITISDYPVKPRRTKGTYSYRARNYFATTCIIISSLFGLAYAFLPSSRHMVNFGKENLLVESDEHKLKKSRLAPFLEGNDLQSAQMFPVLVDPGDSYTAKKNLKLLDPLEVSPDQ